MTNKYPSNVALPSWLVKGLLGLSLALVGYGGHYAQDTIGRRNAGEFNRSQERAIREISRDESVRAVENVRYPYLEDRQLLRDGIERNAKASEQNRALLVEVLEKVARIETKIDRR